MNEGEQDLKSYKNIEIEDGDDDEDQSSPRGVLEIRSSGSDSDNHSISLSSRGSSFNDKSPSNDGEADSATDCGGGPGIISSSSVGQALRWRNLVYGLKWKSVKRFSTVPLVAGYELSRKSLLKRLGRHHNEETVDFGGDWVVPKPSWRNFTLDELAVATDNFNPDNLVGRGGHAEVYKGCLSDGQIVAVKRITKKEKKDEDRVGDFLSELGIIAHINHPNAARLIGFSSDTDLHLVLQFAPHGSLATILHNSEEILEWGLRFKIALGIAEGLQYLHCECHRRIIHRDITASNILLMEDHQPQISDFGLAKWLPEKWVHHIVSPIEGTFGYMAPEYFMHGVVHEKIDVFSFGVLLLELITGRRAVDSSRQSLVIWAKPLLEISNIKELVDPRLQDNYDIVELKYAMSAASACIHHLPNLRPPMKRVIQILKGDNQTVEPKQKTGSGRAMLVDACDMDDYTFTKHLTDLNRHMQLVME
ncbi:receptor-like cytosolic serine/threonine-protein kinase RBK1 [Rutidosis leptorrhynchoides]|uniref:receptor-like cytosolic serine/threonine-protein kinase RBK1 n=1 Tax=Rutidosis leptorrhynchoides TaxID=125765 RepID=UPI003A994043